MPTSGTLAEDHLAAEASGLCVLLVVEPGLDGVFRHVEGLIDFLLKRGVRVHLAYSSRRSGAGMVKLVEKVRASNGEVLDLRVGNVPEVADLVAFPRLVSMIRRVHPDIIHAHSSKAGALARAAAWILRHPRCIYTPHAYYGMAKPLSLKVRFFNWIERVVGHVGTNISISTDEAEFARSMLGIPRHRISVIHNPVDTQRFAPPTAVERSTARQRFGIPEDAVVIATIGRMCWQKDPETAYSGLSPVCAENADLLFLHLGWGKWKPYLLGMSNRLGFGSRLRILDYIDEPRAFYHAIDALVVSSRYEAGWPLVCLEAMASNLPVVASTCMGMSDMGQAGLSHVWTFPPEDVRSCTAAVRRWLATHRAGIRQCNHRNFAVEHFSPERCYGAVLGLYSGQSTPVPVLPIG